jgi:3-oxoacyl-[acyl-carrier protein] reductase
MHLSLEGRTAVVTGGTRGIGAAVSRSLAAAGARVTACYRADHDAAAKLRTDLDLIGGEHTVLAADVSTQDGVAGLINTVAGQYGHLDILVHSAGAVSHVPFADLEPAEWQRIMDTNLTSSYLLVHGLLPLLSGGSSVVLIGSGSALVGIPLRAHYTASKAALVGLTRSLSKELGGRGIRINVLASGVVDTGAPLPPQVAETYRRRIPLGRLGRPEEIAAMATFLASDHASYVTGATFAVDGGI